MTAERHSPLEHLAAELEAGSSAGAALREVPFLAQVGLRAGAEGVAAAGAALGWSLPTTPNTVTTSGARSALWLGPDEWLLVGSPGDEQRLTAELEEALAGTFATVVDLSANRTALELSGPHAAEVLTRGCALDLHPRAFRPDACAQTLLGRVQVILQALGPDGWRIFVRGSFATHLASWLLDAMAELRASEAVAGAASAGAAGDRSRTLPSA